MQKEVSCRITHVLFKYLETLGYNVTSLCDGLPYSLKYLSDPLNWITTSVRDTIADRAVTLTGNKKIMYQVGLNTVALSPTAGFEHMVRLFGSPRIAYSNTPRFSTFYDRQMIFEIDFINKNNALIRMSQKSTGDPSPHACYYAQGILSAIPQTWDLPQAEVKELHCMCHTSPESYQDEILYDNTSCLYQVKWQDSASPFTSLKNNFWGHNTKTNDPIESIEKNYQLLDNKNAQLSLKCNQLNKVREIALGVDSVHTMDEAFHLITESARDIPGVRFVMILKPDEYKQNITIPYFSKFRNRGMVNALKLIGFNINQEMISEVNANKLSIPISKIKIARNYYDNPQVLVYEKLSEALEGFWSAKLCNSIQNILKVNKFISIPIFIDSQVWGNILFLLDNEVELDILEMVAAHCSVALKNVITMERLEKRNQELSAINAIATKAAKTLEIDKMINDLISEIVRIFSAIHVSIYLKEETTKPLKLVGQYGIPDIVRDQFQETIIQDMEDFISSSETVICGKVRDVRSKYPQLFDLNSGRGLPCTITSVLCIGEQRSGAISIIREPGNDFNDDEKSLLISISNQLSIAFENSLLHKNLVQRLNDLESTRNKLSETEEKLHLTIDSLSEGIMVTSLDGRIIQANEAAAKLHGYDHDNRFIGQHSLQFVVPGDRRRMLENLKRIKSTGTFITDEYTLIKKDHSQFETECNISIYNNFLGKPDGFVICIRDISKRKQSEKRLSDSERKYRLIAENTNDYISTLTMGGYFTYSSPSYRLLGYETQELTGKSILNLVHPDDRRTLLSIFLKLSQLDSTDLKRLKKENYSQLLEYRIIDKKGNWHYLETTSNIIESFDGTSLNILLISRDVTSRKQSELQLKTLYDREKELSTTLEQEINRRADFFRALVHELKTPLTPIIISSETLLELANNDTYKNLARNVYNGAFKLNMLVDELLDISKGEVGILKIDHEPVNILQLLKEAADYARTLTVQNNQTLIVDLPESLPVIVGDETRLRQVLLNLLDNSLKFTPASGQIALKAITDERNMIIKVQDTGCGIEKSEQERLFQPYNRIEADRQHFSGLGLGLALCKRLIELHNGRIWIESQKSRGTTFFFSLPIVPQSLNSNNTSSENSGLQKH